MNPSQLSRRQLLLGSGLALAGSASQIWAQPAPIGNQGSGRLVIVLLRGAYDGLSAFVPYADADYYASRPNIAIAAPDGTNKTALKLDNTFALHPALAPVLPLWQQGVLSFIPSAGLPAPNRSHFAAQYEMEIAQSGKTSAAPGWLNKIAEKNKAMTSAIGVGEANPAILAGNAQVRLIPRGQAAVRTGVLANDKTRQALMDLYAGNDRVSEAFRQGAGSRMQSAQELSAEKAEADGRRMGPVMDKALDKDGTPATAQAQNAQMLAASNGASDPIGLQLDAAHLGTLMRNDRNLQLGFLSAGGWVENGTRGTDHGYGNAMWLVGNRVNGGKWHGQWTGLARGNLNEARDLPAHHDYRAVLAQVLRATFAMTDSPMANVLPNTKWDARLDGLMRRT